MADETNQPTSDASGAGTKAHKPSKAEQAKLPGGADFDVAGATPEDFDKHFEILERHAKIASLTPAAAPVPVTVVDGPTAEPAPVQPPLVTKTDKHGEQHSLPQATWDALGAKRLAEYKDAKPQPATPAELK